MINRAAEISQFLAIDKISPLIPLANIGENADAIGRRLDKALSNPAQNQQASQALLKPTAFSASQFNPAQFVQGQVYPAQVLARLDTQTSIVNLNGVSIKMTLGSDVKLGETLSLKYMGSVPSPTFLLTQAAPTPNIDVARISASAQLIQHYLKPEQLGTGATRIEAKRPITSSPTNASTLIAQDLQKAITQTGLFYESHIAANIEGKRSMAEIMQEPQNQSAKFAQQVVSQQLNLLDSQKLVWHGEVWPQQTMEWEIERKKSHLATLPHEHEQNTSGAVDQDDIHSKLSLILPKLGHVSAELHLHKGKIRIQILATDAGAADTLKTHSNELSMAMETAGQPLDMLLVKHHVADT